MLVFLSVGLPKTMPNSHCKKKNSARKFGASGLSEVWPIFVPMGNAKRNVIRERDVRGEKRIFAINKEAKVLPQCSYKGAGRLRVFVQGRD